MNDNALIQPIQPPIKDALDMTARQICWACSSINCAAGGSPNVDISIGSTGLIKFADPANVWKVTTPNAPIATRLYLYAKSNGCAGKTWVDSACRTNAEITVASDETIDHPNPNAATTTYDSINPIRSIKKADLLCCLERGLYALQCRHKHGQEENIYYSLLDYA